jgi:hypothetical protein
VSTIRDIQTESAELWKLQLEELLDDFKSRYSEPEVSTWIEQGQQIKPIELASAIRDALTSD